ncbi:hypothetical protein HYH03_005841 [Edaphochlamys debaryana]|uniref:Chloride channel protein n=1 Tax=Edaphochlamys debaryana TaxID=47281 RepID=A0A836C231_9CHLO|nr:hypothetical protein HYH03_005841 [Edaphochlamys debaryana]|eukprot:KAG2496243.1 hypothetical protein HYH03_005841 [Edaphochlamys debaryana]
MASPSVGSHPTLYRTLSNTLTATCSTSGTSMLCPRPQPRRRERLASAGARREPFSAPRPSRRMGGRLSALPRHQPSLSPAPSPALPGLASARGGQAATTLVPAGAAPLPATGAALPGRRSMAARSASVRTTSVSPDRNGSRGESMDEELGVGAPAPPHAEAQPPALYADLEDAVPYRNGAKKKSAPGAGGASAGPSVASMGSVDLVEGPSMVSPMAPSGLGPGGLNGAGGAAYAGIGDDPSVDEVCVVDLGPNGSTTTRCMPAASLPATVASIMHPATTTAEAAARGAIVDAAIAVSLRPSGFGATMVEGDHMANADDLASDVRGTMSMDSGPVYPTGSSAQDPLDGAAVNRLLAMSAAQGVAKGSIDMADTPEGLTDVEVSSVAPVADWLKDSDDITTLTYAVLTGGVVATAVFLFDVSIQTIHDLPDIFANGLGIGGGRKTGLEFFGMSVPFRCVMPVAAGVAVAWLQGLGFSPALKVLTRAMEGVTDDTSKAQLPTSYWQVARKSLASAITLGSGASLGPEAPSVELGANTAAVIAPKNLSKRRQRMLVAAGAAAGVSAAFDAPVSGALFAVEFVLKSSRLGLDRLSTSTVFVSTSVAAGVIGFLRAQGQALGIAGAGTHLVGRIPYFSIQPNLLVDVAQFSALGLGCSVAAVALYEGVRVSEIALRPLPRWLSAPTAGALCGIIAYKFPQVQYGYVNLEEIFRDSTGMSAGDLTALLTAKIVATSLCVGGGLVGGLFAPSLFLGALVGDVMGHFVAAPWGLPDPTSLVVVGAAAVLGAACRAPLTAVALMVEITRDTGLLVPLLSAIGVASLFTDYLEGIFSKRLERALVELYLREKAFFWAASLVPPPPGPSASGGDKTVEDVLGTRARLYVRHTLPLAQAKAAMAAKGSSAAVVVDDNFSPLGVVYAEDVEAELIRQRLLNEPDANFNRP